MSQVILGGAGPDHADLPGTPAVNPNGVTNGVIVPILGLSIFAVAFVVAFQHQAWEQQVITAINRYARHSLLLDRTVHALTARDLLQGVVFVAIIWYLWAGAADPRTRIRLLSGTAAATLAGIVSRLLQLALPTHPRPLHISGLQLTMPFGVDPAMLNHFSSFPSDHGAVWFALALVILRERFALGLSVLVWAAIIDLARVYDLYHFPSDLLGSVGLAIVLVSLFDGYWARRLAARAIASGQAHGAWFAMLAFVVTFQIATLFDDVREIARGFAAVILHHDPFAGG